MRQRTLLIALCLAAAVMVIASACGREVPPSTAVKLSRADAEEIIRHQQMDLHPNLTITSLQASGPWTEAPGVTKGRPVYTVSLAGELVSEQGREQISPTFTVDATTGEVL